MNQFWTSAVKNWRTTVSAVLTATLAGTAALLAYPPIGQSHLKLVTVLGGIQAVAKVWLGLIQKDA